MPNFPGGSDCKASAYNAGDPGSIPGSGSPPGGQPTPVFCLENPMDGGASYTTVHGVVKSRTGLSDFTFTEDCDTRFWISALCVPVHPNNKT